MPSVPAGSSSFEVEAFGTTDRGLHRTNNEDSFILANLSTGETCMQSAAQRYRVGPLGALFLVCDGMGGEQAGEVASRMCVELVPQKLKELLGTSKEVTERGFVHALDDAIQRANAQIFEKAETSTQEHGMGCTLTAAAVLGRRLLTAQVGDSRAYLTRGKQIKQLTEDQTLGNYLASLSPAAAGEIPSHSHNILTQAVGASPTLQVRMTRVELASGDRVLVCSDGLYNMVPDAEILQVLGSAKKLPDAARELIRRANGRGGPDNITVIVAELRLAGEAAAEPSPPIRCVEISLAD